MADKRLSDLEKYLAEQGEPVTDIAGQLGKNVDDIASRLAKVGPGFKEQESLRKPLTLTAEEMARSAKAYAAAMENIPNVPTKAAISAPPGVMNMSPDQMSKLADMFPSNPERVVSSEQQKMLKTRKLLGK